MLSVGSTAGARLAHPAACLVFPEFTRTAYEPGEVCQTRGLRIEVQGSRFRVQSWRAKSCEGKTAPWHGVPALAVTMQLKFTFSGPGACCFEPVQAQRRRAAANCGAVWKRACNFLQNPSPPSAHRPRGHSQAERQVAPGAADDPGGGKQAEAQGDGGHSILPARVPLEEHAQVVTYTSFHSRG